MLTCRYVVCVRATLEDKMRIIKIVAESCTFVNKLKQVAHMLLLTADRTYRKLRLNLHITSSNSIF